tara:strand:- start:32 stop:454 length:423 start_codon:yes stop_codon:yes gene_type:complete
MTASEKHQPDSSSDSPGTHSSPEEHSRETAERLRVAVAELASQLRPFPPFYGMSTLRAIELELPTGTAVQPPSELGCVVVLPDGEISELDLRNIPGPDGPAAVDQVEEFTELDLPPEQYIAYATVAVQLLQVEIQRRSGN